MNRNLLIIGAGQYGTVAREVALAMGCFDRVHYLDDDSPLAIGRVDELEKFKEDYKYGFVAVGDADFRLKHIDRLEQAGYEVAVLVHPKAYVSLSAKLDSGCIVEPMAAIQSNCCLGKGVLVCSGAVVKHTSTVGDGCYIDCNSTVVSESIVPAKTRTEYNSTYGNEYKTHRGEKSDV